MTTFLQLGCKSGIVGFWGGHDGFRPDVGLPVVKCGFRPEVGLPVVKCGFVLMWVYRLENAARFGVG